MAPVILVETQSLVTPFPLAVSNGFLRFPEFDPKDPYMRTLSTRAELRRLVKFNAIRSIKARLATLEPNTVIQLLVLACCYDRGDPDTFTPSTRQRKELIVVLLDRLWKDDRWRHLASCFFGEDQPYHDQRTPMLTDGNHREDSLMLVVACAGGQVDLLSRLVHDVNYNESTFNEVVEVMCRRWWDVNPEVRQCTRIIYEDLNYAWLVGNPRCMIWAARFGISVMFDSFVPVLRVRSILEVVIAKAKKGRHLVVIEKIDALFANREVVLMDDHTALLCCGQGVVNWFNDRASKLGTA